MSMRLVWICMILCGWMPSFLSAITAGDTCATAGVITHNGLYGFDNTGASADHPCSGGSPTVWYRFTAPSGGTLDLNTCGTSYDTVLTVFPDGACPPACGNAVLNNDDFCGWQSGGVLAVTGGATYRIALRGFNAATGPGVLSLHFTPDAGLSCATPGIIIGDGDYPFNNKGAPTNNPCSSVPTVWFRYVAPSSGVLDLSFCDSVFDTYVRVFSGAGCPVACNPMASNDDACGRQSMLSLPVTAGETYHIAVYGFGGATGAGLMSLSLLPTPNGNCGQAPTLTENGSYPFSNVGAPISNPCLNTNRVVWFRWVAPSDGNVDADTCGSPLDTVLWAFEGPDCPAICDGVVALNDDSCGLQSQIGFVATAGTVYYFGVGGYLAETGTGVFNLDFTPSAGYRCYYATPLRENGLYPYDNTNGTADDPCSSDVGYRNVWYIFTAPTPGRVDLDSCETSYDTYMSVYEGPFCPNACSPFDYNDDSCDLQSRISFIASPGVSYLIAVRGFGGVVGPGLLNFEFKPYPYVLLGDYDGNGVVNVADVSRLAFVLSFGLSVTPAVGDINNDHVVNQADIPALANDIVNK
jgi:hypothetical protein